MGVSRYDKPKPYSTLIGWEGYINPKNKLTQRFIDDWCDNNNITLLDNQYINNNHKHNWYCKKHKHTYVARYDKIKHHGNLLCCSRVSKIARTKKEAIDFANQNGLVMIGTYVNTQHKIEWQCKKHKYVITASLHGLKRRIKKIPCCEAEVTLAEVKRQSLLRGYIFIGGAYGGPSVQHQWYCKKHKQIRTSRFKSIASENRKLRCCAGEERSGARHPNFNPHITKEQRIQDRRSHDYKVWVRAVKVRDGYKCILCGYNKLCVAHHLNSYMAHPKERFDVDNGITLCIPCHNRFHKQFGNKMNTRLQFEEFRDD